MHYYKATRKFTLNFKHDGKTFTEKLKKGQVRAFTDAEFASCKDYLSKTSFLEKCKKPVSIISKPKSFIKKVLRIKD